MHIYAYHIQEWVGSKCEDVLQGTCAEHLRVHIATVPVRHSVCMNVCMYVCMYLDRYGSCYALGMYVCMHVCMCVCVYLDRYGSC